MNGVKKTILLDSILAFLELKTAVITLMIKLKGKENPLYLVNSHNLNIPSS